MPGSGSRNRIQSGLVPVTLLKLQDYSIVSLMAVDDLDLLLAAILEGHGLLLDRAVGVVEGHVSHQVACSQGQ